MASNSAPDKEDLLIRPATSLLSIIGQQVEEPYPTVIHDVDDERSVRFLEHIAIPFIAKPKKNVSAVLAILNQNTIVAERS